MSSKLAFLAICVAVAPGFAHAACSRANLTRCLDSACAVNISTNPAARCQYCGTANAGTPANTDIKSVSVGGSTKFVLSDKDLKSAPSDPGQRYVWATRQCIQRVNGCSADDVSDTYDKLIEQSCTAAGISSQLATLTAQIGKTKSETACNGEISVCVQSDAHCHTDFSACTDDAEFTRIFSLCATETAGCDEYTTTIHAELSANRNIMISGKSAILENVVKSYQNARQDALNTMHGICDNNAGRESCIAMMCAQRMPNKCATSANGKESDEKATAEKICKFYDTACATLK